jgi:hypothetical protein
VLVKEHRVLHCHHRALADGRDETSGETIDGAGVTAANGPHVDDLPVQELYPSVLAEQPRVSHAVPLVGGKSMAGDHQEACY